MATTFVVVESEADTQVISTNAAVKSRKAALSIDAVDGAAVRGAAFAIIPREMLAAAF